MKLITLSSTDSTNRYLKDLVHSGALLPNFLTVFTPIQTAGVGQYGAKWQSAPHMNLTFSTLFTPENLTIERGFVLNMLVPIAVVKALKTLGIAEEINIKWPNDIVITRKKIGGILIENIVQGQQIIKSVIGIGLNVNQTNFEGLPKASSLAKIIGHTLEVKKVLEEVMCALEETLLQPMDFEQVYPKYEALLFGLGKVATFCLPEGEIFMGIIKGVAANGRLIIATESGEKAFRLKEVEMLY
ncbi:biotin--[acetyl-CoA-carboxylase] ligase [Capnocytophaga bilenii]